MTGFACATDFNFTPDQIAVALSRGLFGGHLGIAFYPVEETPRLLHLRWHEKLALDRFPPPMVLELPIPPGVECWIARVIDVPKLAAKQVVGVVRAVARKMPRIAFGLGVIAAKGSFRLNGDYTPSGGGDGLTCATFVSEVLRVAGVALIDEGTWLPKPENVNWGQEVINSLKKTKWATQAHIDAVAANNQGLRIRPEELAVAAGSSVDTRPLSYTTASAGVLAVRATLDSCCPLERLLPSAIREIFPIIRRFRIKTFFS